MEQQETSTALILSIGDILYDTATAHSYRIIYTGKNSISLCTMCKSLRILSLPSNVIYEAIFHKQYEHHLSTDRSVHDLDMLKNSYKESFQRKYDIIRSVSDAYGPTFEGLTGHQPKEALKMIQDQFCVSRQTLWNYIHTFLKSGLNYFALMDRRTEHPKKGYGTYHYTKRPGRPSENGIRYGVLISDPLISIFKEALKNYLSGRFISIRQVFTEMNIKHFSKTQETNIRERGSVSFDLLPATERPTYPQLYHFIRCHSTAKEREISKTSAMEYRNNKRLLLGDTVRNARYPGRIFEMDETEFDLSLVSSADHEQTVGRPILYAMQDSFSKCIVGISVSFDNNSVVGFTNCLMSLADDKADLCNKYGVLPPPSNIWPSGVYPGTILSDRGVEYRSMEAQRICQNLNIQLSYAPAGTGSMKGNIEQLFHQIQTELRPYLDNVGLISKRHDSKHHKQAALTLNDFWKIIIQTVITYNQTCIRNYPMDKDMIRAQIIPTPANLWNYGCDHFGSPRFITNKEQFYCSLMKKEKASLGRDGIQLNGLFYLSEDDMEIIRKMESLGNKRERMDVLLDPRDISSIYYLRENRLVQAVLMAGKSRNNGKQSLTMEELQLLNQAEKELKREGEQNNETLQARQAYETMRLIGSVPAPRYSSVTNMSGARQEEKTRIQYQNSIVQRLSDPLLESGESDEPIPDQTSAPSNRGIDHTITFEEAMDLFEKG